MPNRIIKEAIHTSETVNRMTDFQFRLWVNLITYVDDYGRGDARPSVIKGFCFPLRERLPISDISKALQELAGMGCVTLYEVDGKPYLCFPAWESHQNVRNKKSRYPAPENGNLISIDINCNQTQAIDSNCPRNPNPNPNPYPVSLSSLNNQGIDNIQRARTRAREDRQTQTTGHVCEKCGRKITEGIVSYSLDQYGMKLCKACQEKTPKKSSPAWTGDHSHPGPEAKKLYERLLKEEEEAGGFDDPEPAEDIYEEVPY